jgi:hypothetical protein
MTDPPETLAESPAAAPVRALDRPIPLMWRVLGVIVACVLFYASMGVLGGPVEGDAAESVYATWAIAHGDFGCAYPTIVPEHLNALANQFAQSAPLYPLISGGVAALLRVGHTVPFPSAGALGRNCTQANVTMFHWSVTASAILTTIRISYIVWPLILIGALMLVRAGPRRRSWWEVIAPLLLAVTPPLWMCLVEYFHPGDLLAMALILVATAAALKSRWAWCGVAIGLAVAAQQLALLAAVPLLVVAPARSRTRYLMGAVAASAVIDVPLLIATSGRALRVILTGSSRAGSSIGSTGGTVVWELHLHGHVLFAVARLVPIVAAGGLAVLARRRLGPRVIDPVTLVALLGTCQALRLVFEQNLYGYYFMALAVFAVMLDSVAGRLRGVTWAWIALIAVAWNPVNPGFYSNWTTWGPSLYFELPIAILVVGLATIIVDARRRIVRPYKVAWLVVVLLTSQSRVWGAHRTLMVLPHWAWQLILVPTGLALCARPLLSALAGQSRLAGAEPLAPVDA